MYELIHMWEESGPKSKGRHNSGLSTFGVSVTVNVVFFHRQIWKKKKKKVKYIHRC